MPRYSYKCSECDSKFTAFHGMSENINTCEVCGSEGTLKRVYDTINLKKVSSKESSSAGTRVKEFIEESRQALKEHQEEVRKEHD